jgi:M6 family metalloprotease-like protein
MSWTRMRQAFCAALALSISACGSGGGGTDRPLVSLAIADPLVHVGSYHPVEVHIDPAAGLTLADLTFTVPAGPTAGNVSVSQEATPASPPTVLLLVGPSPGAHALVARRASTGAEVARLEFFSTTKWGDEDAGPSVWFTGTPKEPPAGSAWGGGPATPQNFNTAPALGTRRIAIVLVDTSTQRFTPAETAASTTEWSDHAVGGVTTGGVTRSLALYYDEVSYGNLAITAQVFGPYELDGSFDDFFFWGDADPLNFNGKPKGQYFQACITAADADVDYTQFDSVLCVSRTDDASDPAGPRSAWPYAGIGAWGPYTTSEGDLNLGVMSMPSNWNTPGRTIFETLSHEFGHNLGIGDQYAPGVPQPAPWPGSRNVGAWDMMHADEAFPHFAASHRMIFGWIDQDWIRNIDFARAGGPVDETVQLEAIERGTPTLAAHSVLEIRVADGWNYYFELRSPQAGQIGDQSLPRPDSVLGTDAAGIPFPVARPFMLLLGNDPDGDGSALRTGENYRETDFSDPTFPTDFRVDVTGIAGDVATVRVRYGVNSKPDPSIHPWPAGPDRPYQSPDIEVRNARNAADPTLANVPWAENPNTIAARITNRGNLNAQDVVANFYVKDYTVGGAPEFFLGSDTQTIGPGATAEFTASWTPPREGHFCVIVRIPLYVTPVGAVVEMTELNNVAQSNYDRFISATASPASRAVADVVVGNPLPNRTRVILTASQTNPWYRTYLEHRWVVLAPGELRRIRVMFEHAGEAPGLGPQPDVKALDPNRAIIRAFIEDSRSAPFDAPLVFDGLQALVQTGRATQIDVAGDAGGSVSGTVRTVDDQKPVQSGRVIVSHETAANPVRTGHQVLPLTNGSFATQVPSDWTRIHATYLPQSGFGLTESDATKER